MRAARRPASREPPGLPACSPNDPEKPRYGAAADEAFRVVGRNLDPALPKAVPCHIAHELLQRVRRIALFVTHAAHDLLPGPVEQDSVWRDNPMLRLLPLLGERVEQRAEQL